MQAERINTMNHQPVAQSAGGMSVSNNEHDLKLTIKELKHQWAGYKELPAMVNALEADGPETLNSQGEERWRNKTYFYWGFCSIFGYVIK